MKMTAMTLVMGLMLVGFEVFAQQAGTQKLERRSNSIFGCCRTSDDKWCCSIGRAKCQCSVTSAASRSSEIGLPDGVYQSTSLKGALQDIIKAFSSTPKKLGAASD